MPAALCLFFFFLVHSNLHYVQPEDGLTQIQGDRFHAK